MKHAPDHGLQLEYTRNNPGGLIYEPWHWVFSEVQEYTFFAGGVLKGDPQAILGKA
jgi:hypothetical protein